MMQHKNPEDWVLATGVTKTVREFAIEAFSQVNLNWEDFVLTSEKYLRPNEVDYLLGDSSKARKELKWKPSVDFSGLVKIMVEHDINEAKKDLALLKDNLISPTWEYPKYKNMKVLIVGSNGFLGSHVKSILDNDYDYEILEITGKEQIDITKYDELEKYFSKSKPDIVINCAAFVGGISYGYKYPARMLYENSMMAINLYKASQNKKAN